MEFYAKKEEEKLGSFCLSYQCDDWGHRCDNFFIWVWDCTNGMHFYFERISFFKIDTRRCITIYNIKERSRFSIIQNRNNWIILWSLRATGSCGWV